MQPNCPASNHVSERLLEVTLSCWGSDSSCVNRKLGRVGIGDDSPTTHLGQKQLTHLDLTGATSPSTKTLLKKTEPHFQALPGPKNMIIFYASFQIAFTCFLWTYLQICQNLPFFYFGSVYVSLCMYTMYCRRENVSEILTECQTTTGRGTSVQGWTTSSFSITYVSHLA